MLEQTFVRKGVIARLRRSPLGPHLDQWIRISKHVFAPIVSVRSVGLAPGFTSDRLRGDRMRLLPRPLSA
ncbi:MAG: hypothetical protein OEU26_35675 [Candidatus Tectomicrobia bacterium]|nr:hypothetical protein [Candidatus Tectomicrobia bacterium]